MSAQTPNPSSRMPSTVPKRDIMWNIIEPGDPYDIRKSMIAKLPGRKNFMGEHLELVCLLQAAQIQRLCEYLEQYKLKLREVERRELDRHSYEIQIKQLTQRISDEANFKAENVKLRDFLRKQTAEFEDLRKRLATTGNEEELLRRYEDSLHQIEIVMNENEELKQTFMRMRSQYEQAVASKNTQIEDLQRKLKQPGQLSKSESTYKMEVQAKKLQFQNRRLKQIGQARNKELQEVQGKCKQLIYQLQEQNTQMRQYSHLSSTIKEYESRFAMLGEEIDRLNSVLRDKTAEGRQLANKYRALQQEKRQLTSYINELQGRKAQLQDYNRRLQLSLKDSGSGIDESRTILRTYQTNLEKLSLEIQRLNKVLRMKMGQLQQCERRNSELQQELRKNDNVKKQIQDFRARFSELSRKMTEYQNRILISAQQIQRLNQVLKRKNDEAQSLQARLKLQSNQLQNAHNQYYHLQIEYKTQINYITNNYQAKIAQLEQALQEKPRQPQTQLFDMREQIQRLNSVVVARNGEIQQLRKSSTIGQGIKPQVEHQLQTVRQENYNLRANLDQYESRILMLSQQIQRLNTVIRTSPSLSPARKPQEQIDLRKLTQYENKLSILSQEIDRLNDNLRARDTKIKNYEQELQRFRKVSQPENQQALRTETQLRISSMSNQIDRLSQSLRRKSQQTESLQQKLRNVSREADDLRNKTVQYQFSITELSQHVKGSQLNNQYQIDGYKRKITEQEKRISELDALSREIDSKYRAADQQSRIFEQQIRSYQQMQATKAQGTRQIYEYQSKIVALSHQIQRLNKVLQRFNNQNQDLKRKLYEAQQLKNAINALEERLALAARQNENLKKSVNEGYQTINKASQQYEFKIKQISVEKDQLLRKTQEQDFAIQGLQRDLQYTGSIAQAKNDELSTLDGRYRTIQSENELLKRKVNQLSPLLDRIGQYDSRMAMLSQQIDRLNNILRSKTEEITILDNRCYGYENQLNNYQRKVGQLQNNITKDLQTKNATLYKENEELRGKVKQLISESARVNQFQNKLALTLGQVQRLNNVLKGKIEEIDHIANKLRASEQQLQRSKRRNDQLQSTMHRQLKNQSLVFEQRISQLSAQNQNIRKSVRQLSDANRIIPQLQNKLAIASGQVQRLNGILHKLSKDTVPSLQEKAKRLTLQCEQYRQRCTQLGESNKQGLEAAARLKLLTQQNEQSIRKLQEYQGKIGTLSAEIDRLNGVLRNKLEQLNNCESKLRLCQNQYEQLNKRYKETSKTSQRLPQYESKIALLGQQLQRINGILRSKTEELATAQSKIRMLQHDVESSLRRISQHQNTINEHKRLRATLEQRLTSAGSENEELRRSIRDLSDSNRKVIQYQSKLTLFSQEVQRLNLNLRTKTDELVEIEKNMRNMKRQAEVKISSISSQLQEYRRKASQNIGTQASRLAEYESKMTLLSKQIQRLNIVLKETTFELQGSKGRQRQCLQQIQRLNNTLRIKVEQTTRWQQANNELKIKLRSTQQSLSNVNSQFQKLRQQHIQLTQQYKKSNQQMVEYEQSINKLYQQFQRLQNIIQNLKKQNYDLKLSLQEAGNLVEKNRHLSAQIDRLMKVIQQQTADLEELRLALADQSAFQKRINEYMALMVVLFAQIQSLRCRVKDTEKQIQDVRRSSLAPFKV